MRAAAPPPVADYRSVDTPAALADLVGQLGGAGRFTVDVETTDTDPLRARLVGIAIATAPGRAWYVPVGHRTGPQLPLDAVRSALAPIFADRRRAIVGHNLKYDALVLDRHQMPLASLACDTMVAASLLESSQRALGLKDVVFDQLGIVMTPIEELIGPGGHSRRNQITMAEVSIGQAAAYAAADADMTLRLAEHLAPRLADHGLDRLFDEVEMPLVPVLADLEKAGVALDVEFLKGMSTELHGQIVELEQRIHQAAGHAFNVNSTQQLAQVLYEELRLPTARKTQTGYSTDASTLEALRHAHPIVGLILDYRQLVKLKSTYVDALPTLINPTTGRLHTSFNQTGTSTGRLSSSQPNLQNIPVRTELGRQVRRAFIARPDHALLAADYSQIELRILAHVTEDPRLLAAFAAGEDIHAATAAQVFGIAIDQVNREQRDIAKRTNFGLIYGQTDYGLAAQLGISRRDAADFITRYFERYPTIRRYLEETKQQARERGYVTTLLGRRRFIPGVNATNQVVRGEAERMAINAPIQGTAADIIKIAMIRLHAALREQRLRGVVILQVHDELVLETPRDELPAVAPLVREIMEGALALAVPLVVDVAAGPNWRDLEPLERA